MPNPNSSEKMQIVVDSLQANPDVVVVGGFERTYLATSKWPTPSGYWSRTLDIYTHPTEPIYKASELNEFMRSLVPELEPTTIDSFHGGKKDDRELGLGKLYYDESIGKASLVASVELNGGISAVTRGILAEEWTAANVLDLRQRTWVRVFPNAGHLANAARGHNQYRIPVNELHTQSKGRVVPALFEAAMLGGVLTLSRTREIDS